MTTSTNSTVQSALNMVVTIKPESRSAIMDAGPALMDQIFQAADAIGTLHDARFVLLNDTTIGLFTTYDGDFETYVMDFVKYLGPVFDLLLAVSVDPPPLPVEKNAEAFVAWVKAHDLPSIKAMYSAYPTLTVQDIKAMAARG